MVSVVGTGGLKDMVSYASTVSEHQDAAKKLLSQAWVNVTTTLIPPTSTDGPDVSVQSQVMVSLFVTVIILALIGGCMHMHRSYKAKAAARREGLLLVRR